MVSYSIPWLVPIWTKQCECKMQIRERKSKFVKLFDKTPAGVVCPHFFELVLSNGCPYNCSYCYLKLTFRGKTQPTLFDNNWAQVREELDRVDHGVFSTGELADSLAVPPPLLEPAVDYFKGQNGKYLLLVTKSDNISVLKRSIPDHHVIVSFSLNSDSAWGRYEQGTPNPDRRLSAAATLREEGWRIRIRLDPVIVQAGMKDYEKLCRKIVRLEPEIVTIGMLRQYPGVHAFSPSAPRDGLRRAEDGRMRYEHKLRVETYQRVAEWLGTTPSLCKETKSVWGDLKWKFHGCNCTP